jgi:hypothetical protein
MCVALQVGLIHVHALDISNNKMNDCETKTDPTVLIIKLFYGSVLRPYARDVQWIEMANVKKFLCFLQLIQRDWVIQIHMAIE